MTLNRRTLALATLLPLLAAGPASAQGLSGLLGRGEKKQEAAPGAPKVDPEAIMLRGTGILVCLALANERAMVAQEKMLGAFPEDRIAELRQKFEKYNELEKARKKDDSQDAAKLGAVNQAATDCQVEFAKLMEDKAAMKKGYGKQASEAYTQVGWALGIDALAVAQIPGYIKEAQALVQSLGSNPLQFRKVQAATALITTLSASVKTLPGQVQALTTVRGIAKKVAQAEKVSLKEPVAVTDLDPKKLQSESGSVAG